MEESIRQGNVKPFIEEAVLQVSNWGFSLRDLQVEKKCKERGLFDWFKNQFMFLSNEVECELVGFLDPIHIWQVCDCDFFFFFWNMILRSLFWFCEK